MATATNTSARPFQTVWDWVVAAWILAAAACLTLILTSAVVLLRMSRRARPLSDTAWDSAADQAVSLLGLRRRPALLKSPDAVMPMTWGVFFPKVLLPGEADQWDSERRRIVLLHEFAHVGRRDCAWLLVAKLACAASWYHPLIWYAVARLRAEAERACDDRVLRTGQTAQDYAEQLLSIVWSLGMRPWTSPVAVGMARTSTLDGRLRAILDVTRNRRAITRTGAAALLVLLAGIILPTSMLRVSAQPAKPAPAATQSRTVPIQVLSESGYPRMYVAFGNGIQQAFASTDQKGEGGRYEITVSDPTQTHWYAFSGTTRKMTLFTIPAVTVEKPLLVQLDLDAAQLIGRVTDAQSHGVVGASVQVRATTPGLGTFLLVPAKTDTAGYYEFDVPAGRGISLQVGLTGDSATAREWSPAVATRAGQVAVHVRDLIAPHPNRVSQDPPWRAIGGVVRDENGHPLPDATVMALCSMSSPSGMPFGRHFMSSTDSDGRWTALVPPVTRQFVLRVSHEGFVCDRAAENSAVPTDDFYKGDAVIVLHKGLVLVGIVRDPQGRPVPDALVTISTLITSVVRGGPVQDETMGRTDANGKFRLTGMTPGPHELTIYATDYPPLDASANVTPGMKPAEITIERGGSIEGTVVDASGKAVQGARVGAPGRSEVITDASGRFKLDGLSTQRPIYIGASMSGGMSATVDDARVGAGPYRLVLLPRPVIRGKVLDDLTGQPITHFQTSLGVRTSSTDDIVFASSDQQESNSPDGTFERRSPSYPTAVVSVRADAHLPARTPEVKAGEAPPPFVLRLKPAPDLRGNVRDPDGAPAAGASVAWVSPDRHAFVDPAGKLNDRYLASPEIVVKTDAQGRFILPPSPEPGTIVAFDQNGYAQVSSRDFKNGSNVPLTAWARITGTLDVGQVRTSGRRVQIILLDRQLRSRSAPINWMLYVPARADGSFTFDHVPAFPLGVGLPAENGLSHRVVVTPKSGQTLTVRIRGGGREVIGQLALPAGLGLDQVYSAYEEGRPRAVADLRPVSDAGDEVALRPDDKDPSRVLYEGRVEANRLTIDNVPPGDYVLHVAVRAAPFPGSCSLPVAIANATANVQVTPEPANTPLDIGAVRLKSVDYAKAGAAAPDIQGQTTDGKPFALRRLGGKVVLLDFWATWCPNCRAETPHLKQIAREYEKSGRFALVGVNLDYTPDEATQYIHQLQIAWPNVLTPNGWGEANPVLRAYGVAAIPSYWLVGPDGRVIARDIAPNDLDRAIEEALK